MSKVSPSHAAYFNVARHNVLLALNHVAHKSGLQPLEDDEQVANHPVLQRLEDWAKLQEADGNIGDKDIRAVKQVINGLQKALPILGDDFMQAISGQKINLDYMSSKVDRSRQQTAQKANRKEPAEKAIRTGRIADMHWALETLIKNLMAQRNYFSHAYQNPVTFRPKSPFANLLGIWFDTARREAKSRFDFMTHEVHHLLRHDEITKREDLTLSHALTRMEHGAYQLTDKGASFFCCLFLDKQQGNEFLNQLDGFKCDGTRAHQATLRTYTHWSIRLPFVRIDTTSTSQSLALDVFNELARCPVEIFEQLNPEQQKEFAVLPDASIDTDAEDAMASHFIRHSDRFAPLMMACFDQLASANEQYDPGIRFMLDLGDFYFAAYPKKLPDSSTDVRRLKQKVLRFGLLPQALEPSGNKPDAWTALERVSTVRDYDKPYIVQSRPHHHWNDGDNIPIKLKANCSATLYDAPQLDPTKPDRFLKLDNERPDFWLSRHELVNLAFYHHLRGQHALAENEYPKVDNLLRAYQSSLRRLYENICNQPDAWQCSSEDALREKLQRFATDTAVKSFYNLLPQDLPEDLQALLLCKNQAVGDRMAAQGRNTLQLLIDEGEARLHQVQRVKESLRERIKPGKQSHRVLRAGEMATYLAKDILRLQPVQEENSAHKGKPTSIMADLLQARLAYFGREKTSLPALFSSLRLIGNADATKNHPFLQRIRVDAQGMNGIAQFYEAYLHERQAHLKNWQGRFEQGLATLQSPELGWLHLATTPKRMHGKDNLLVLVKCYLERLSAQSLSDKEPLNLPRGLFRQLIVKALLSLGNATLSAELQVQLDTEAARARFTSPSILVALYFSHVQDDASQEFYYLDQTKLNERIEELDAPEWQKADWVVHFKKRIATETPSIRGRALTAAVEDEKNRRSKKLRNQKKNLGRTLSARETQDQVLFLMTKYLIDLNEVKAKSKTGNTATGTMFDKIKLQTINREKLNDFVAHEVQVGGKTIYTEAVKAKNIGKFKSLSRDRRLPGLLHYYPVERIHFNAIVHELQAYPRAQNQAFEKVLDFEAQQNKGQKLQANDPAVKSGLHRLLVEQRVKQSALPTDQRRRLQAEILTLRNAFCHNQIPKPGNAQKEEEVQPMLMAAFQTLATERQDAKDIAPAKSGQSVAQHFANILIDRYEQINKKPQP